MARVCLLRSLELWRLCVRCSNLVLRRLAPSLKVCMSAQWARLMASVVVRQSGYIEKPSKAPRSWR
jgi:inorganic pyrophosphatase/exopolyphosphatase